MRYDSESAGSIVGEASTAGSVLSFADIEGRLIEAMQLCWQSEGGNWPYASDGPWHLVTRELYGPDVDKDTPLRKLPLTRAQVARRDEAIGWLALAPEADRRLIVLAVAERAKGAAQVPWRKLLRKMGLPLGAGGLSWRYSKAMGVMVQRVNRGRAR